MYVINWDNVMCFLQLVYLNGDLWTPKSKSKQMQFTKKVPPLLKCKKYILNNVLMTISSPPSTYFLHKILQMNPKVEAGPVQCDRNVSISCLQLSFSQGEIERCSNWQQCRRSLISETIPTDHPWCTSRYWHSYFFQTSDEIGRQFTLRGPWQSPSRLENSCRGRQEVSSHLWSLHLPDIPPDLACCFKVLQTKVHCHCPVTPGRIRISFNAGIKFLLSGECHPAGL